MATRRAERVRTKRRRRKQGSHKTKKRPQTHQGKTEKPPSLSRFLENARRRFNTHGYTDELMGTIVKEAKPVLAATKPEVRKRAHEFFARFSSALPERRERILQNSKNFRQMRCHHL